MQDVDIDLLRADVTVLETDAFSQAAERLFRDQSAMPLQIKRLEEVFGLKLLDRSPRHLSVMRDGEILPDYARDILGLNNKTIDRIREPEITGLALFGMSEDFATAYLPRILSRFARSYPDVQLEVTFELKLPPLKRFRNENLDLQLVKREPDSGVKGAGHVTRTAVLGGCKPHPDGSGRISASGDVTARMRVPEKRD
ncbi:MAG: LysR family transcriptional regulator [Rhodospirillaceae bacterium]|nr:LysR family transcriptional regulator [Rhodospirillaceae bacterium]